MAMSLTVRVSACDVPDDLVDRLGNVAAESVDSVMVRAATASDVHSIRSIYAPMVTDSFASFEESVPAEAELTRRILARPRMPWLVAVDAGTVVGYAYASQHRQRPAYRWSAGCSVYISRDYRRRGVGHALYQRLIGDVRDLGYMSLFAGITLPNAESVGLHEAMGFERLGVFRNVGYKNGSWRDVGWWQRALGDLPATPDEPREWSPKG
jgi:L-amino acid N-acyltransferase YncA